VRGRRLHRRPSGPTRPNKRMNLTQG
jgi:hypothetical protein